MFIIAYVVGAILAKIKASQPDFIETKVKGISQYGIFANNFKVALGMFIPGFGVALGGFLAFSTGLAYKIDESKYTFNLLSYNRLIILITFLFYY